MKTVAEFIKLLHSGAKPVVQFGVDIGDKEAYADTGMRARVIGVDVPDQDGVVKINFDFEEFEAFNLPFEQANYYDSKHNPVLTARQAGYYKPQERLYFDVDEDLTNTLTIVESDRLPLYQEYTASGMTETYVSWLESKVLKSLN